MKFKAQTKAKTLLDWLKAINAVADECIIDTSETDAVVVRVVDPANALMLDIRMPDHAWDLLETEPGRIGTDLALLIERVKMFDPDKYITITTKKSRLVLTDGSARYTVRMIDPDSLRKATILPELDLPAKITVDAKLFQRFVMNAASLSDHIRIGVDTVDQCMFVRAEGDTGDYEESLSFDGEIVVLAKHRVNVSSLYSLDYTTETSKNLSGDVVIEIGTDLPMLISFVLHDAIISYVQAPRIEKD